MMEKISLARPVVVQAGSSETGQRRQPITAWPTFEEAQAFCADVKGRIAKYDYSSDNLKVMRGVLPVIGRTEEEEEDLMLKLSGGTKSRDRNGRSYTPSILSIKKNAYLSCPAPLYR